MNLAHFGALGARRVIGRCADSPLAVYAWIAWSASLETYRGGLEQIPADSLKLRDRNSSANVILAGNGTQAAQVGGSKGASSRQRRLVVPRRMRCRVFPRALSCGL
jgi:hypothetical protein